ncbi:MAG: 4-hydroxythreonine-4-phosphate dehydrogenase PdxA [bacterium]
MKPIIGITMGDAAGIGAEITAKMFKYEKIYSICSPVLIGSKIVLEDIINILQISNLELKCIKNIEDSLWEDNVINLIDLDNIKSGDYKFGKISPVTGKASGEYIAKGIQMAISNQIDAIVTNPIHKESFTLGGYGKKYAGHTEMLADLTGIEDYTMMLVAGNLRVVHVSTHVSLKKAVGMVEKSRILKVIKIANEACNLLGIRNPKIVVAGLNPHCGEGGLFGDEEIREIIPAVEKAQALGINALGPLPSDSVFAKALGGVYDVVVTMYHDQGHIPTKTVGFVWDKDSNSWGKMHGVNVTLGLPIIRTSVDHGTAFGKAGKGSADYTSLFEALKYAVTMAKNKKQAVG